METDWPKLQSQTIDLLRFPMAVAVVMLHYGTTVITDATGPLRVLCILFEEGICRLAVPCFFLISGYLFFKQLQKWDWSIWREKIKRRVWTLFVPYSLWIIITFFVLYVYCLLQCSGGYISLYQFFLNKGGWKIFWGVNGGLPLGLRDVPLNGAMWFLRDLIYYTIATPAIYLFITHTRRYGVMTLCLGYLLCQGLIPEGFLFFLLGAYFQISGKNILVLFYPKRVLLCTVSLGLLVLFYVFFDIEYWSRLIKVLFFFWGIGAIFSLVAYLLRTGIIRVNRFLVRSSFFIFVTHEALILRQIAIPLICWLVPIHGQVGGCLRFFFAPTITVIVCLLLLYILERILPRTTNLLIGNRNASSVRD